MHDLRRLWDQVPPERRHIIEDMEHERSVNQLRRFDEHCEPHVEWEGISHAMDWGCGGGLLSRRMEAHTVALVDVSRVSLHAAIDKMGHWTAAHWLPNDPADFPVMQMPDLLLCYAVIHHMPGLQYFKQVCNYWRKELKPKHMALQFREGPYQESQNYTEGEEYMWGLTLPRDYVENELQGYDTMHYGRDGNWGHLVLQRV